jgi:hypothetical protein
MNSHFEYVSGWRGVRGEVKASTQSKQKHKYIVFGLLL